MIDGTYRHKNYEGIAFAISYENIIVKFFILFFGGEKTLKYFFYTYCFSCKVISRIDHAADARVRTQHVQRFPYQLILHT